MRPTYIESAEDSSDRESGHDELNLIVPGGNYGWPLFAGEKQRTSASVDRAEYIFPAIESGATETWAPAGLSFLDGHLVWGGLRGAALYRAEIAGDGVVNEKRLFFQDYGRIRTTTVGPNGRLYFMTSNRDGRGKPVSTDDRLFVYDLAR